MLPAPNPPSDPPSATVSLGEEEEEEGDTFVLGAFSPAGRETTRAFSPAGWETTRAFSPAGRETTRAFSPAGRETTRAFSPAGQEGYDIRATSGKLESAGGDSTAKDVGTLTEDELPEPKDQPRPNLALVPLTETTHSFVPDTTHQARPSGSTQLSGRLQTEVVSNASGPSCPPEENLSEGERGVDGEVTVAESNARAMALAPKEEEEDQHATFPCLPPDPVCV